MATRLSTRSCGLYKILVRFGEHSILVCYKTLALRGFALSLLAHISAVSAAWVRLLPNVHSQDVKRLVTQAIALRDWIKDCYQYDQ